MKYTREAFGSSTSPATALPLAALLALIVGLFTTTPVLAQNEGASAPSENKTLVEPPSAGDETEQLGPTVQEIEIEYVGPRSISRDVILSNMRTTVGQPYSPRSVEEDVRTLYSTGFFVNLRIYDEPHPDGVKVVVIVQPKPVVKEIIVTGAEKLGEKRIRKKISTKVGDTLSEQKVAADAQAVRDYYQEKGFKNAQVEYKIDVNEQIGRAVLTYVVTENEMLIVHQVKFIGNESFSHDELQDQMKTRPENWLSFINKSGRFLDEQFNDDLQKLREFYFSHGYIDMEVKDVDFDNYEPESLRIAITLFEGIQYRVGNVQLEGNTLYTSEKIRKKLPMLEGGVFSPQGLDQDVQAIKDLYGEDGYIDTEVIPERQPNIESGRMDIVFKIREGSQYYVEQVVIQGNTRTKDKVIRRELALTPGDVYDSVRADASKKRLENLGYFSKVEVTRQDPGVPGRKNMVVSVEEKRTGSVTFGVGFSTIDSVLGFVELQQGNFDIANFPSFTGAGQKFRTRLQYGLRRKDFTMNFTEPWFLDQRLSLGFDLFYNEANYLSSDYDQRRYGTAVRLARALNEFWTVGVRYQIENIEIFDVDGGASNVIKAEKGSRSKSSVRGSLTYDTRDNVFLTHKGERVEFWAEGAGGVLMGDTDIWKLGAEAQKWWGLPYDLIFSAKGSTAVADSYNGQNRVPIFDRYFLGGSRTVRGFDYREVGPRDSEDEPIGGLTMAYSNFELTYPIIDRVRGAVFYDMGVVNSGSFDYSAANYEAGVGFGFRMDLPIGPLRIDFGFPVVYEEYNDHLMKFHFDVGYQF